MRALRTTAFALIVSLIGMAAAPAYAAQEPAGCKPAAAASAHRCCKTPVLKACCSDQSDRSGPSAPAQPRAQLTPNFTAASPIFVVDLASVTRAVAASHATPRAGPVDLPTLHSTLLL